MRALILRMLSVRPEQRGTAAQLAEALERISCPQPERNRLRRTARPRWPWFAVAASLMLLVGAGWAVGGRAQEKTSLAQATTEAASQHDAGTAGLGETASVASTVQAPEPSEHELAEDPLPEPQPGQVRPNAKGRCPHRRQIAINGACWVPSDLDPEQCDAIGNGKLFQGRCYVPAQSRESPSTSHPTRTP